MVKIILKETIIILLICIAILLILGVLFYDYNPLNKILPNKQQTIITYCSSGSRSKEAQERLENMGYENVYNLKGGLDAIDN